MQNTHEMRQRIAVRLNVRQQLDHDQQAFAFAQRRSTDTSMLAVDVVHVRTSDIELITSYSCGTVRRLLTPYVTEG